MPHHAKKQSELKILREVYKKKHNPKYTVSEKPDFILHAKEDFGVEVTEYYPDETVARLHNLPDYASKILDKTYIHKDDESLLETVDIEYQDRRTGKWKKINTPGIRQENKSATDRLALLVKRIGTKSSLYDTYDDSLEHIDLIVDDSRNTIFDGINDLYILQTLNNFLHQNIFASSGFRNIYLTIPLAKNTPSKIFRIKK